MTKNFVTKCGRRWTVAMIVAASIFLSFIALADFSKAARRLNTEMDARRLGLTRAWFAQVRLDPARNHVEGAVLAGDRLTVLTSAGVVQELNALTGQTMWIAPIGNPDHPSLGPAASDEFIAVLNGSNLYVLDRADGRPVIIRPVGGAPGAAPALAKDHVFVPLVTGRIEGYPLREQKLTPWNYQSFGRAMVAPLATPESFVWATNSGHLYVGNSQQLGVRFRLETGSEIFAPPAYEKPYIYVATAEGGVFALHELLGMRRWKYATGYPVTRAPAAVGGRVFVTSEEPTLHCIDVKTGSGLWEAPKITQFAAASRNRVYGIDELGALVAMDAATGTVIGRMANGGATNALVNDQTDRIYLVSDEGMVQCLHEFEAKEPLRHKPATQVTPPEEPPTNEADTPTEPTQPTVTPPPKPVTTEDATPPAEEADAVEAERPAEESEFGVDDENPFDFE